jgi:D-alanyl-D-alanine carboxypeptidase
MNRRAKQMGLGCTRYVGSDGLSDRNRSCAADLAALARVAMAKPRIRRLARRKQLDIPFPIKGGRLWLNSTNPLLALGYPGTIGLKTGYTDRAGHCFVGIARRGTRTYGVVLLHSPNTGRQAQKLLDAAFALRT